MIILKSRKSMEYRINLKKKKMKLTKRTFMYLEIRNSQVPGIKKNHTIIILL